jgi:hypothetical protein
MSRKDRIELQWFYPFFKALRRGEILNTGHSSVDFHEKSHFLGMLKKAGLIQIVAVKPITKFRATDKFNAHGSDKSLIAYLKKTLKNGLIFETPVRNFKNEIVDWTKRRDGTPIIRYTSLGTFTFEEDAEDEVERTKQQADVSLRPGQAKFSARIRKIYGGKCAITGCGTSEALQAAHIKTSSGKDYNAPKNGILLRSDIHALLDAYLITFNEAGTRLVASRALKDKTYNLDNAKVAKPKVGTELSPENIKDHRRRFKEAEDKRKPIRKAQLN